MHGLASQPAAAAVSVPERRAARRDPRVGSGCVHGPGRGAGNITFHRYMD